MKGVYSNPDEILNQTIKESLFPHTTYGMESGGHPENIPELTYERFIDFHKRYYHPSNSFIYLYGNGNIEEHLELIHTGFLSRFNECIRKPVIRKEGSKAQEVLLSEKYPVLMEDEIENRDYLSLNYVAGEATNPELHLAMDILTSILFENDSSPLKKALKDLDICKDVRASYHQAVLQPYLSIILKDTDEDHLILVRQTIRDTLRQLVEKGIDKDIIRATVNITEFHYREANHGGYPKGLIYGIEVMESWLYGGDPGAHLKYEPVFENIKEAYKTDYFEKLIQRYLIDNSHKSIVILKPERGLNEKKADTLKFRLANHKANLNHNEIRQLMRQSKELEEMQQAEDPPEMLETIPILTLDEIEKDAKVFHTDQCEISGRPLLYHDQFTSGIVYLSMYFDMSAVPQELLPYITILGVYLGRVSTENYDFSQLVNEIKTYTGGITFFAQSVPDVMAVDRQKVNFVCSGKATENNISKVSELAEEIILRTRFDEKDLLRNIIREQKLSLDSMYMVVGHGVVAQRLKSYYTESGNYETALGGFTYYDLLVDLVENFDEKYEEVFLVLKKLTEYIFNINHLVVSVTTEKDYLNKTKAVITPFVEKLPDQVLEKENYHFDVVKRNEGLMTSGDVLYVGTGYNFKLLGYNYLPELVILKSIVSLEYFWNQVRVQGGAYGSFFEINRSGNIFLGSYRDPHLKRTLEVFKNTPEYIKNINISERELRKHIIGSVSTIDKPLPPSNMGSIADKHYFSGLTYEIRQKDREGILSMTLDKVVNTAELVQDSLNQNAICVLGNENKIKEHEELFDSMFNILK
jgi:hypothetical protein